jgi:catechol 2,3-dioxygenase-like lactoylglutathione lyase family enzyme
MHSSTVPVLRIFDAARAREFYVDFLGMSVDWEHRFDTDFPLYLQVSRGGLVLHLSEHSGDCSPGAKLIVHWRDVEALERELTQRDYPYCKPRIEQAPWGDDILTVTDPFSNRIVFNATE